MQTPDIVSDDQWAYVLTLLPGDLEESARRSALRRCRNVPSASALMRMTFAYAVSDLSMKDVAAWAHAIGLAEITVRAYFIDSVRPKAGWQRCWPRRWPRNWMQLRRDYVSESSTPRPSAVLVRIAPNGERTQ